jgi:hypothetical protein
VPECPDARPPLGGHPETARRERQAPRTGTRGSSPSRQDRLRRDGRPCSARGTGVAASVRRGRISTARSGAGRSAAAGSFKTEERAPTSPRCLRSTTASGRSNVPSFDELASFAIRGRGLRGLRPPRDCASEGLRPRLRRDSSSWRGRPMQRVRPGEPWSACACRVVPAACPRPLAQAHGSGATGRTRRCALRDPRGPCRRRSARSPARVRPAMPA